MAHPKEPACLAMLHAHLATGKATRATCGVIYAIALGNYASMSPEGGPNHWTAFNTAIKEGLQLKSFRHLDAVKKLGWSLYESTVDRLGLPPTAPKP